jgi:hypothetical protein
MQILIGIISSLMLVGAFSILLSGWESKPKRLPAIKQMRYEDYVTLTQGDIINYYKSRR